MKSKQNLDPYNYKIVNQDIDLVEVCKLFEYRSNLNFIWWEIQKELNIKYV